MAIRKNDVLYLGQAIGNLIISGHISFTAYSWAFGMVDIRVHTGSFSLIVKEYHIMFEQIFENVRRKSQLVHCITNYVTVNDCANMLLACGVSPIMADDPGDAVEITNICGGLTINIGTLNQRTIPAMLAAGKRANELCHSVVLDPVGAGASTLRTDTTLRLLKEVKFTVMLCWIR